MVAQLNERNVKCARNSGVMTEQLYNIQESRTNGSFLARRHAFCSFVLILSSAGHITEIVVKQESSNILGVKPYVFESVLSSLARCFSDVHSGNVSSLSSHVPSCSCTASVPHNVMNVVPSLRRRERNVSLFGDLLKLTLRLLYAAPYEFNIFLMFCDLFVNNLLMCLSHVSAHATNTERHLSVLGHSAKYNYSRFGSTTFSTGILISCVSFVLFVTSL